MVTWNDLFTQGTLIDYSVHLWRARIQLKPEDLGIDMTDDIQKAFSFGCHRLAPASAFEEINAAVGGWERDIKEHSLAFPILDGVRYVPDDQVKVLQQKLDMRLREFNIAVEYFIAQYENMMTDMLPIIEQALLSAAKTPEAAAAAISRVTQEYPSREKVAQKFGLEWNFFTIAIPASKEAAVTAKSAIPQVQKVINSMVEQLRNELSDKVASLLDLAKKAKDGKSRTKEGFGSTSRNSALAVLDKVDRLNVLGDTVLREQTQVLRSLLDSSEMDMNTVISDLAKVKGNLESDIATATAAAEKKLTGLGNRKIAL
jgi:hypothetical protein